MRKLFLCSALLLSACGDGGSTAPKVASLAVAVPTPNVPVGQTVQLTATTLGDRGAPLAGRSVTWASLDPSIATVSSTGLVTAVAAGVATITAEAAGQTARADVYVTAGSVSCSATAATAPAVGEVRLLTGTERSAICLPAVTAGGEYVLIGFNGTTDTTSGPIGLAVTGERVVPTVSAPSPTLAAGGASLSAASTAPLAFEGGAALGALTPDTRFHIALRSRERRELAGRLAGAARARAAATPGPSYSVAPSGSAAAAPTAAPSLVTVPATKGATVRLNVEDQDNCRNPDYRGGRVVAVGTRSIIVADTANPANGFTEADYNRFAAAFDTLVYPADTKYFGEPSDIDDNKRSVIFFTRAVNELTPRGSDSYVGGFFYGRDLFPAAASGSYGGCPGSNEAEMFYMLVPDPSGVVNGNVRRKGFVDSTTVGVLAHEFQHLINLSRKLDVNAPEEEAVWLNEGLSHVAEEVAFYRASGFEPRKNITAAQIRSSERVRFAFNEYQGSNFGRLRAHLRNPEGNSPFARDDSLATRGATWQFLRYAVDRTGGDEAAVFRALTNSKVVGFANINAVFGGNAADLARDWAVAQYVDDTNIGQNLRTSYQFLSWNYRDIYAALSPNTPYPLKVTALPSTGATVVANLVRGGSTYVRFGSAPGATATVRVASAGAAPAEAVRLVLVRTK